MTEEIRRKGACQHENFQVHANVGRLTAEEGGPVSNWTMDISVSCIDCSLPFEFIGVDLCGSLPTRPTVDIAAQELRVPIKPKGSVIMPGLPGFVVRRAM